MGFLEKRVFRSDISLEEALAGHQNSLGFLRLIFAFMVILSHTMPLGGFGAGGMVIPPGARDSLGGIAVVGFFALSGYLIVRSARNLDVVQFLWHRVLRIFPAFWVALIFGAIVIGPIAWTIGGGQIGQYFSKAAGGPLTYLTANWDLTMRQYGIYDIFSTTTPYGEFTQSSVLNGSLWTLVYEWGCYLIIAALVVLGVLKKSRFIVVALATIFFVIQIVTLLQPGSSNLLLPFLADNSRVSFGFVFLVGASIGIYADKIRFDVNLALLAAVGATATLMRGGWTVVGYPAFAYLILWLAAALPKVFQAVGSKNDYSYGVYIYGFLVQQFTASLGWNELGILPWAFTCAVIAFGLAWLSWHVVEKNAMKLKRRGPGRGMTFWVSKTFKKQRVSGP
jgi:peptidoglycan/LPS O-acetylase OafA/YrhL